MAKPNEKNLNLDEKEISIIHLIQSQPEINQREISKSSGISLGLVNVILKRLMSKGLLKAKRINRRKLSYALTPSGFFHVVYNTLQQINQNIQDVKNTQKKIFESLSKIDFQNFEFFIIKGNNELSELVENTLVTLGVDSNNVNPSKETNFERTIYIYCEPNEEINPENSNFIRLEALIA